MILKLKMLLASLLIVVKLMLFIYPAIIISLVILDPHLKSTGQSQLVPMWFETTASKYYTWAEDYLETEYAVHQDTFDVPATEWPMFGSVFFLLTAQELQAQGTIDATKGDIRLAIDKAVKIVTSPKTATWVQKKWKKSYLKTGKSYLEKENVFYRMLLIKGIASYEKITGHKKHHALMLQQATSLANELMRTKLHLRDDYPNQCYPCDVLWAVSAIQNANKIEKIPTDIKTLTTSLMSVFNNDIQSDTKLPAFQVDADAGRIIQDARGSSTSGILQFASALDLNIAKKWYANYEKHFWKETPWLVGFKEFAKGETSFMDADTGFIINEFGSVASLFGIGASKSVGRLDHTVLLTIEAVAYAWPTPFGFLIPSVSGKLTVDSWSLGDVALLFTMTRPIYSEKIIRSEDSFPWSIWVILFAFISVGILLIWIEAKWLRWLVFQYKFTRNKKCHTTT